MSRFHLAKQTLNSRSDFTTQFGLLYITEKRNGEIDKDEFMYADLWWEIDDLRCAIDIEEASAKPSQEDINSISAVFPGNDFPVFEVLYTAPIEVLLGYNCVYKAMPGADEKDNSHSYGWYFGDREWVKQFLEALVNRLKCHYESTP
jgi:hypothetical protein